MRRIYSIELTPEELEDAERMGLTGGLFAIDPCECRLEERSDKLELAIVAPSLLFQISEGHKYAGVLELLEGTLQFHGSTLFLYEGSM